MPRGNRRGPLGQGPLTGRGAGYCGGNDWPGSVAVDSRGVGSRWPGRFGSAKGAQNGGGRGRGRRGRRNGYRATGLTWWQRAEKDAGVAGEPIVPESASDATASPEELGELVALRELTAKLGLSLEDLESRLLELERRTPSEQ